MLMQLVKTGSQMHANVSVQCAEQNSYIQYNIHSPGCGVVKHVAVTVLTPAQFTAVTLML